MWMMPLHVNQKSEYDMMIGTALAAIWFGRAEPLILYNFGRGHYEEHFCKIILNLD